MPNAFFTIVCPILGMIIGNGMWLSPLKTVLDARAKGDLGDLNPAPWVVAYNNCIGWTIYSFLMKNYFIFFSNVPGIALGVFYSLTSLVLMTKRDTERDRKLSMFIIGGIIYGLVSWSFLALIATMLIGDSPEAQKAGQQLIGSFGVIYATLYYVAPLSTAAQIIRDRDASSLYVPMIVINMTNASLWTLYGTVGVQDVMIWLPNVFGIMLSIFQLTLCYLYRSPHAKLSTNEGLELQAGPSVNPMTVEVATEDAQATSSW